MPFRYQAHRHRVEASRYDRNRRSSKSFGSVFIPTIYPSVDLDTDAFLLIDFCVLSLYWLGIHGYSRLESVRQTVAVQGGRRIDFSISRCYEVQCFEVKSRVKCTEDSKHVPEY